MTQSKLTRNLLSLLLSVALMFTTLPVTAVAEDGQALGYSGETATSGVTLDGETPPDETETEDGIEAATPGNTNPTDDNIPLGYSVVAFAELSDEVKNQSVPFGTALEDLALPDSLDATVSDGEDEADITIEGVTWQSAPEYAAVTIGALEFVPAGTYVFTSVLPEGYTLSEVVDLPVITVELQPMGIVAASGIVDITAMSGEIVITEPTTLTGTNPDVWVVVKSTTGIDVTLSNLNITIPSDAQHSPMKIVGKANITLVGDNTLDASAVTVADFAVAGLEVAGFEASDNNEVTIDGDGSLTAKGGQCGAGICNGFYEATNGTITIKSGTIIAAGGQYGAGIGGGGGNSSAIGSWGGFGGTVIINNGIVTAFGGGGNLDPNVGTQGGGAGIGGGGASEIYVGSGSGGGFGGGSGIIIINGGVVTATGAGGGAGIGGGAGGNTGSGGIGETITITGGYVNATGSRAGVCSGAGIGGGGGGDDGLSWGGSGGTITISGGEIIAASVAYAAVIGGGSAYMAGGDWGNITISNGVDPAKITITNNSSQNAVKIGSGFGLNIPSPIGIPGEDAPNLYTVTFHGDGGTTQELMFCHTEPNGGSYAKLPTADYLLELNPDFFGGSTPAVVAWTASSTATTGKAAGKSFNPASSADYYLVSGIAGDDNTFDVSNSTGQLTIEEVSGSPDNTITVYDSDDIIAEDIPITETITLTGTNPNVWVVVKSTTGAKVKLDDLNITIPSNAQHSPMRIEGKANITLEGDNTLDASATDDTDFKDPSSTYYVAAGLEVSYGNEVTIGAIDSDDESGKLTAKGGYGGPGIGGCLDAAKHLNAAGGIITINSGTINAAGGLYAAGINGGTGGTSNNTSPGNNPDTSKVTINGGNVTATGGDFGAGIGGNHNRVLQNKGFAFGWHGGEITINGGTVAASGGRNGAGIGGGGGADGSPRSMRAGNGGTITINGGNVVAKGNWGAGIGGGGNHISTTSGGSSGHGGTITITGGNIYAASVYLNNEYTNSNTSGAGIGGGGGNYNGGNSGDINITGGVIVAGGYIGIGSGWGHNEGDWPGNIDSITITNGVDPAKIKWAGGDGKIGVPLVYNGAYYDPAPNLYTVTFHGYGGTTQQLMFCHPTGGSYAKLPTAEYLTMLNPDFFGGSTPAVVAWTASSTATTGKAAGKSFNPASSADYYLVSGIAGDDNTFDVSNSTGQLTIEEVSGSPNTIKVYDSDGIIKEDIPIDETITLTGTNPDVWVVVKSTTGIDVELSNLNITLPDNTAQHSPMRIEGKANITLEGDNTLDASAVTVATFAVAGLEVSDGNEVTIDGDGSLTAKGGQYGAGIGGGFEGFGGTITIENGTINATGGEYAAGIGGGGAPLNDYYPFGIDAGNLTINGGTITATGGHRAAGIGGGSGSGGDYQSSQDIVQGGHGGYVIINGGNVTAIAKYVSGAGIAGGGAGIGGGWSFGASVRGGAGAIITINGGTVSATGAGNGAGIGGGGGSDNGGQGGSITITGGYVNATGMSFFAGYGGAGIGGGGSAGGMYSYFVGGDSGTITISGGEVIATSNGHAAAIGGGGSIGRGGYAENITISSGVDPAKITANVVQGYDVPVKIGDGWGYGRGDYTDADPAPNLYTVTFHGYGGTKTQQLMFCHPTGGSYATLPTAEYLTMLNPDFFSNGLPASVKWATTADAETGTAAGGLFDPSVSQDYYLLKQDVSGSITFSNPESVTYNGSEHAPQGATIDHTAHGTGSWTYTYAVSSGGSLNGNGKPVGAGTYTVTAKYADDTCQGKKTATFIINKANPSALTPPTASGVTYGAALSTSNLTGGSTGGSWAWTTPATIPTVVNSGYSATFTPSDADNYDWTTLTATVNIAVTPCPVTITGVTTQNKTYDGTATAPVGGSATLSVNYDGGNLTITAGTAAFDNKNVGTGKDVTFSGYALGGSAAGNYTLAGQPASATADITAADYTYTVAGTQNIKHGSGLAAVTVAPANGAGVNSETVSGTLNWYTDAGHSTAAQNSDISGVDTGDTVTLYWTFTATDTNYNSTTKTGSTVFTIVSGDPQDVTFPGGNINKTYGDANFTNTATNASSGGGAITYNSGTPAVATVAANGAVTILKAGTVTITATAAEVPGTWAETSASYTLTVNPKTLTAGMLSIPEVDYTGNPQTPVLTVTDGAVLAKDTDYTVTLTPQTDAGTYSITVTGIGNYTGTPSVNFAIHKAVPSLTWPTAATITYGASLSTSALTGGGTQYGSFAWTNGAIIPTVTNSGYDVTFTPTDTDNYDWAGIPMTNTVSITVNKATPVDGDLTYSLPANVDYNGNPQSVSVTATGKTGFGVITVKYESGTTAPTNAGDYTVTVDIAEGANYAAVTGISLGTFTVNKIAPTAALLDYTLPSTVAYDGGQKSVSVAAKAAVNGLGVITVKYNGSATEPTDAGVYAITADIAAGTNYSAAVLPLGNLTINGVNIPIGDLTITPYSGTYDGAAHGISVSDSGGGTVTYCDTLNGTYISSSPTYTNAGTYTVYFKVNRGGNYNEYSGTSTVAITKAALTITGATISAKTYDGTTTATVTGVTLGNLQNGESLTLNTDFTATGVFNSANAGAGRTVTVTVALTSSAKASNYSLPAPPTFSLTNQSIAQATGSFGTPSALNPTYTPTLTLANLSLPTGYTWDTPSTALSAGNGQSFAAKYNNPNGNYTEATGNITVNVAKANQATLTVDAVTGKTFGNADFQLTTSGGSGTGAVSFTLVSGPATLLGDTITITGAGNIVVNATKAGDTNYNGPITSSNRTIAVAKAPAPTISWPISTTITYGAALSTSALSFTSDAYGSFAWTNGATVPTVTNSGYSVTFTPSAATLQNYEPISPLTQNMSITVNRATTTGVPQTYEVVKDNAQNYSFDLTRLLPNVSPLSLGTVTYEINSVINNDGVLATEPSGTVTSPMSLNVASVAVGKTASITVTVHSSNYSDFNAIIIVNSVNKIPVTITGVTMTGGVYKGSGYAYSGTPIFTPTAGGTAVTISSFDVLYESTDGGGHNSATAPTNAGAYKLTLSVPTTNSTYTGSAVFTFAITQKQITVKADDKAAKTGDALPTTTVSYTGFVGTDNVSNALTTQAVAQHTAADTQAAGTFPINITTDAVLNATNGANYTLNHQNGTLTVTSLATFTITATAGANGSISPSGAVSVTEGDGKTFAISANSGYRINNVTVDGVNKGAISTYTFTNVTGNHTISASFAANGGGGGGGSGGGGSGGGGGTTTTPTPPPTETWLEQNPAGTLANSANGKHEDNARTKSSGAYGVRAEAWAKLAGFRFEHDTMDGNAVQVRLYINSPEKITKDTMVSGYVKGSDVDYAKNTFEKYFDNKVRVVHFDQQGAWEQPVKIAARVDLAGIDTKKLYFYAYDKKANIYRRIEKPAYWIDKNGYLHFITEYAGDIIVSENPLEKR